MTARRADRPGPPPPPALHAEALESLRYIRDTMEASAAFTAVPGRGMVAMGVIALAAAPIAARRPSGAGWLAVWLAAAALAGAVGLASMARKSRAAGTPLLNAAGRRFALAFAPPVLAGAVVTAALLRDGHAGLLPGLWLLLYGVAALAGGMLSVPAVPAMGACFAGLGAAACFAPAAWGDAFLAAGFGALHVGFGIVVWRKHGG